MAFGCSTGLVVSKLWPLDRYARFISIERSQVLLHETNVVDNSSGKWQVTDITIIIVTVITHTRLLRLMFPLNVIRVPVPELLLGLASTGLKFDVVTFKNKPILRTDTIVTVCPGQARYRISVLHNTNAFAETL